MTDPTSPTSLPSDLAQRLSPLHDIHVGLGATFTDFAGWQMPVRYSSDLAEHHAVRNSAGLFDISHMAEIVVTGPDAARRSSTSRSQARSAQCLTSRRSTAFCSPSPAASSTT